MDIYIYIYTLCIYICMYVCIYIYICCIYIYIYICSFSVNYLNCIASHIYMLILCISGFFELYLCLKLSSAAFFRSLHGFIFTTFLFCTKINIYVIHIFTIFNITTNQYSNFLGQRASAELETSFSNQILLESNPLKSRILVRR